MENAWGEWNLIGWRFCYEGSEDAITLDVSVNLKINLTRKCESVLKIHREKKRVRERKRGP